MNDVSLWHQAYCDHRQVTTRQLPPRLIATGLNSYPYEAPVDSLGVQSGAEPWTSVKLHPQMLFGFGPIFAEPIAKTRN